ncbi:hypothetical protein V7S43_009985 [Phytophthora oleae]|uniref:CCHC-type domain-containing protein n=1 Tax=Phytophthora oleae TaxID=2107226 RepID=A0ABD3FG09_9STRA
MSHFGAENKPRREKPEREEISRGPPRSNPLKDKTPFKKQSFKPGHYAPAEQTKEGPVCYYCKKPGHIKRDCFKLNDEQGNDQPHQ